MTTDEPMSTPDSGGLPQRGEVWKWAWLTVTIVKAGPKRVTYDTSDDRISSPTDRFLTRFHRTRLAAHSEPVPTPDSADDATVGERECPEDDLPCSECPDYCHAAYPATPPADDANRAPVSGGLDEGERVARASDYTPPMDRIRDEYVEMRRQHYGFADLYAAEFDRALAARDAAWVERLAAVEGERDGWRARRTAAIEQCRYLHQDGKTREQWHLDNCGAMHALRAAEAERDTARREAGERIARALRDAADEWPWHDMGETWLRARADALTSDDGSGA